MCMGNLLWCLAEVFFISCMSRAHRVSLWLDILRLKNNSYTYIFWWRSPVSVVQSTLSNSLKPRDAYIAPHLNTWRLKQLAMPLPEPMLTQIYVTRLQWVNLGHHCFQWWLVTCSAPSHYLNQCWIIIIYITIIRSKIQWNSKQIQWFSLKKINLKISSTKCEAIC